MINSIRNHIGVYDRARVNCIHRNTGIGNRGRAEYNRSSCPCMLDIYRFEYYLQAGCYISDYLASLASVPEREKDRLIREYGLRKDPTSRKWVAPVEHIWMVLNRKYSRVLNYYNIHSVFELELRIRGVRC